MLGKNIKNAINITDIKQDLAYRAIPKFNDINGLAIKSWRMPIQNGVKVSNTANKILDELSVTAFGSFPNCNKNPNRKINIGKIVCIKP